MDTPDVRQWSDHVFATYVPDGTPYGRFVGTASTREDAAALTTDPTDQQQSPQSEES